MTWLAFRVEVHTTDQRDDTPERIKAELLRALEHRFSAVLVEVDEGVDISLWVPVEPWKVPT